MIDQEENTTFRLKIKHFKKITKVNKHHDEQLFLFTKVYNPSLKFRALRAIRFILELIYCAIISV